MKILLFLAFWLATSFSYGASYHFHPLEEQLERGQWKQAQKRAQKDPYVGALVKMYEGDYAYALKELPSPLPAEGQKFREYLTLLSEISKSFIHEISTTNFTLRVNDRDQVLREGALEALSLCQQKVQLWIGYSPDRKVIAEVYRKKKDFALASTLGEELLKKSGVIGIAKFHRIMVITPEALPFGYSWQDALCHEYLHHSMKAYGGLGLPLWFHEGFARSNESLWREADYEPTPGDKEALLLAAKEGRLVSFERMEPSLVYLKDEAEIALAFTQVALSLVRMRPHLNELVAQAHEGVSFEKAFEKVYSKNLGAFEAEMWEAWRQEALDKKIEKKSGALRTVLEMETDVDQEKVFLGPKLAHLIDLGDGLRRRGASAQALRLFHQAQQQEPSNPYVLSRIVRSQIALGKQEEALQVAQELVKANPQWPPGFELLGSIYEQSGLYEEAIVAYRQYLFFNPYHQNLYKRIASLAIDLGDSHRALEFLDNALILDPNDKEALQTKEAVAGN